MCQVGSESVSKCPHSRRRRKVISEDGLVDLIEYVDGMSIYGYNYEECVDAFRSFAVVWS